MTAVPENKISKNTVLYMITPGFEGTIYFGVTFWSKKILSSIPKYSAAFFLIY